MGETNTPPFDAYNHFGSGDIPFSSADHTKLKITNGKDFLQVPFMLGAISFFHSVPADDLDPATRKLNLDRCVLSGIFQRTITTWDDPAIKALNPGMKVPAGQKITVVTRFLGSSSTSLATTYLSDAGNDAGCTNAWTIGKGAGGAGNDPKWPAGTEAKQGSGGVSDYLAATPYSIGYVDSGHGHSTNLAEIALKNADGNYLTSLEAGAAGIAAAGAAAVSTNLAADMSQSWHTVSLMNQAGANTWPICTFSYLYIRKDMSDASLNRTGPLVKAFAEFVLSAEGQAMVPEFGFNGLSSDLLTAARTALTSISLTTNAVQWTFETSTAKFTGMAPTVFSVKRATYNDIEREAMAADVTTMKAQIADLRYNEVVQLHGSGTTNPRKLFWKAMDLLEERAMVPMAMTYRAVGSSTGQYEFIGKDNTPAYTPWNHFGSGDIPVKADDYTAMTGAGKEFIHVPFQLGSISFFHSVPKAAGVVNLDACTLVKIFQRDITTWDHADIKALNPGMVVPAGQPITVVRRTYGSSSTSLSTEYLDSACPGKWTIGVGSGNADASAPNVPIGNPQWPSDTVAKQGSGGVSDYLAANEYSIGYLDAGHGHKLGLSEIALKNAAGKYLTSKEADVGSVTSQVPLPAADASWADVSLMNKPGDTTWPITTFSYLYIRKDLTAMGRSSAAVKAFAEFIISQEGQDMVPEFGFDGVPANVLDIARAGLAQLKLSADATPFTFESAAATLKGAGMMPFVLSGKRQSYADYERELLVKEVAALQAEVAELKEHHDEPAAVAAWYEDPQNQIDAALAVAALGLVMGFVALVIGSVALVRAKGGGGAAKYGTQV